jgi:hypothetical protein
MFDLRRAMAALKLQSDFHSSTSYPMDNFSVLSDALFSCFLGLEFQAERVPWHGLRSSRNITPTEQVTYRYITLVTVTSQYCLTTIVIGTLSPHVISIKKSSAEDD